MINPTLAIAMHEAGHTIAMLALDDPPGPYIEHVTLTEPTPGVLGMVKRQPRWWPQFASVHVAGSDAAIYRQAQRRNAELDVLEILAGPVAELRHRYGRAAAMRCQFDQVELCFDATEPPKAGTDLAAVRERLLWSYPDTHRDEFHCAWESADALIAEHWRPVRELGRLLLSEGYLDGDRLEHWWEQARQRGRGR